MPATKTAALPVPELIVPADLIDEYGAVTQLRDDFAPTEQLYQKLKGRIAALVANADPESEFLVRGERYIVRISACSMQSTLDIPAVRKTLGAAIFLEVASVTKKALEGFLLKPQIEALCAFARTGSRSYAPTAIPKDK